MWPDRLGWWTAMSKKHAGKDRKSHEGERAEGPHPDHEAHASSGAPDLNGADAPAAGSEPSQAAGGGDSGAAEIARLTDRLMRLQADFDNFRKRTLRDKGELYQRANEDLMAELLPVLDHLTLAMNAAETQEGGQSVLAGIRLVRDQFISTLERFGLKVIAAEGLPFDPHRHEAIAQMASEEVPEQVVLAQTRCGYLLGERLLRAAQVVVSSGSGVSEAAAGDAGGEGK